MTPARRAALDLIRYRKQAYRHQLDTENKFARIILADLFHFCRGGKSTFNPDPQIHALLTGRKEVFQRIMDNLNLSESDLYELLK